MQAGIMPRLPDSMPMLPVSVCSAESVAASPGGAADVLSQCTTEWSRHFIASRIALCGRYTAALAADLNCDQSYKASQYRLTAQPSVPVYAPSTASKFSLDDSTSSWASSLTSLLSSSPTDSAVSDGAIGMPDSDESSPIPLRKVASCVVTAREAKVRRKRVQFADEVGQSLTRVKILTDPLANEIQMSMLSTLDPSLQQLLSDAPASQLLRCKFSQPSSRYVMFRESVERNLVCLSLVHLDFSTIRGAIAVKNVSYHKRVFARVSFDSWRSFRDVEAAYNGSDGQQDNFSFSVQCPSNQTADVQFCVCFECDSGAFWDNNSGENYRIGVTCAAVAATDSKTGGYTSNFKPNYCSVNVFSEFSAWEHFTDRVYY